MWIPVAAIVPPDAVAPDAAAPAAAAEDEEIDDGIDGELLRTTKEYNGWRVSYCKFESDDAIRAKFKRYLEKCAASVGIGAAASRHKPADFKQDAREKTKAKIATASQGRILFF